MSSKKGDIRFIPFIVTYAESNHSRTPDELLTEALGDMGMISYLSFISLLLFICIYLYVLLEMTSKSAGKKADFFTGLKLSTASLKGYF